MRGKLIAVILPVLMSAGLSVAGQNITVLKTYRIGYTDGYKKGYIAGMQKGYEDAVRIFRRIYREKLQEYKELEAGKILLKNYMISYPRVYQISTPHGSRIVVDGCKVMRPVDSLLRYIPLVDPSVSSLQAQSSQASQSVQAQSNSNQSSNTTSALPEVQTVPPKIRMIRVEVPVKYESFLQNNNYVFYKKADSDTLRVYLYNPKEEEELCSKVQCIGN